ncbi:hypothetical protein [Actinoplanes siamensis]|uniref:hypothetical protein n=1 Tax=Actinoplanes siamensis TaxID=1223317 RepID=UPI001EF2614D|nr:hypothetical protein [Actinoplanes siamensis]
MAPLDDHSQPRRLIFFPVVIATVLLTIIGMIGGYLLSERRGRKPVTTGPGSPSAWASPAPILLATDGPCPKQSQEMGGGAGALGTLSQVLRITTDRKSVVWICQDEAGKLFYHANKGGQDAPWEEGRTALFLPDVERLPDGSFRAVATWDRTVFTVSGERVVIRRSSGAEEVRKVVPD